MITGKDYLETLRIQDETIYDNAEGMHSLECLLDDFLKENQAKHNEVLGDVIKPPLGLKPKYVKDEERIKEISEAMNRYVVAKIKVPNAWIKEYMTLTKGV